MTIKEMNEDVRRLHKVHVDETLCMGCMRCVRHCCYDVYKWNSKEKLPEAQYSEECVGCLQCMYYCPSGAIYVEEGTVAFYDPIYDPFGLNDPGKEV